MRNPQAFNIITILRAEAFINDYIEKIKQFVLLHAIPEFPHKKLRIEASVSENNSSLTCRCKRPSFGKLVQSSNITCSIEWFHYDCVEILRKPRGKWYCHVFSF